MMEGPEGLSPDSDASRASEFLSKLVKLSHWVSDDRRLSASCRLSAVLPMLLH